MADTLRGRIIRGLRAGTLEPGARLPSTRDLMTEFAVDHRLILAAYRQLADEGLVEIRERGGIYVAPANSNNANLPAVPIRWYIDTLTEAYVREIAPADLAERLRQSMETLRLRAVVISSTDDQVAGLARELREDFGFEADGITADAVADGGAHPSLLRRADVLIATRAHVELVKRLASELAKPFIEVDVRPDLVVGEWALLLRQPVWAVVATRDFGEMLKRFFANVRGVENLHVLVHGQDDLSQIPDGAPTYVTHRVREALRVTSIKGNLLPAARTLSVESARQILDFAVRRNLRALHAIMDPAPDTPAQRA